VPRVLLACRASAATPELVKTRALVTLVPLLLGLAAAAAAAPTAKPPARIVFPVIGPAQYTDDFGDARPQGRHEGIDIVSVRRALAVAAEAGTVEFDQAAHGAGGCMLYLHGRSGTKYLYVHLNNDLSSKNDNRGRCVAGTAFPMGLRTGAKVTAGQPIGYVGDSGDADGASPHLHFELHPAGRDATNPYVHLRRAMRLLFYAPEGSPFSLALTGRVASFEAKRLRLKVETLRWWPGGLRVPNVNRLLGVDVLSADLTAEKPTGVRSVSKMMSLVGRRVTVWTTPAPTTRAAQLGKDGELYASRVVLLDD
jgi:murein DD-endopeptidase MepM/ murein hydrolase activator NlpD